VRTLDLGRWVYLRDLSQHSIFLHPDGVVGFGVVGLTQPVRDLTGGPGCLIEAGLMAYAGHFICDGLLGETVGLGPSYRADYNQTYKELKAIGAFHAVPRRGFLAPQSKDGKTAPAPTRTRVAEGTAVQAPSKVTPQAVPARKVSPREPKARTERDPAAFTPLQGQYLAFVQAYTTLNGRPPAERDFQVFFKVTPPVVHQMLVTLATKGLLQREPGKARCLKVLLPAESLPILVQPSREG
jgi:hypothetical protein